MDRAGVGGRSDADETGARGAVGSVRGPGGVGGAGARRVAGFTLIEVLVALVVAGLLLPTLARAFSGAWTASRTPMDLVSAMTLARDAAAGLGPVGVPGYRIARSSDVVDVKVLPSTVAPAPARSKNPADQLHPEATPTAMKLAIPAQLGTGGGLKAAALPSNLALRRIAVVVTSPTGRRVTLESIALDATTAP